MSLHRCTSYIATLSIFTLSMLLSTAAYATEHGRSSDASNSKEAAMDTFVHLNSGDTIGDLVTHPAFSGFGQHTLPRQADLAHASLPLGRIQSLLPYHSNVRVQTVLKALNAMVDEVQQGNTIFYNFYTEQEKIQDPTKNATGLFFFRGKPGAPFAVVCPGGGFSYVGSVHEGFPYALEISKQGYNAFVLHYRVGDGGNAAVQDLAAALSYIFANAQDLGVSTQGYSLWGSSAGARMAAALGTYGSVHFGGDVLPRPAAVVMAYTGHGGFSENDPPTFVIVGENDNIVSVSTVEKRVRNMQNAGIDVEYRKYKNIGHGFGLGTGTVAEGWIAHAMQFWNKHLVVRAHADFDPGMQFAQDAASLNRFFGK